MDNKIFKNVIFNANNNAPSKNLSDLSSDDKSVINTSDNDNNDPTDVITEDEQEIGNDRDKSDDDPFVGKVFNIFMMKYPHLDNFKNREIIYNICKIAFICIPGHTDPYYYINFIESSINMITKTKEI